MCLWDSGNQETWVLGLILSSLDLLDIVEGLTDSLGACFQIQLVLKFSPVLFHTPSPYHMAPRPLLLLLHLKREGPVALSGLGLVPQGAGHPFPVLAMFAFPTTAHAGISSELSSFWPLAFSFPISVSLFPFQERLVPELFWGRHEAAILEALLGVGKMGLQHPSTAGKGVQENHPEPSASTSPLLVLLPLSHLQPYGDENLKDRVGEMIACLLEPKRSDEQYLLHLSPYPSLCLHAGHPLPLLPDSIPAKKLQAPLRWFPLTQVCLLLWGSKNHPPHNEKRQEAGKKASVVEGRGPTCDREQDKQPRKLHVTLPCGRQMQGALSNISCLSLELQKGECQALPTGTGSWGLSNNQDWGLAL